MDSKVTFLMVAYNTEQYVKKAVLSVLNQTDISVNIIVRDNGSADRTRAILDELASQDSRVTVIHNKVNGVTDDGRYFAENGWWYTDENQLGEYVSIVDSDDYISSDFVDKMYKAGKDTGADIVFAGNYFFDENGITGERMAPKLNSVYTNDIGEMFGDVHMCFRTWWGKLFKKEFFIKNYERAWACRAPIWWCIDTIVMMEYLKMAETITSVQKPLYYMYQRSTSTYNKSLADLGRLLEAYAIHEVMSEVAEKHGFTADNNVKYIDNVHWGYLKEVACRLPEMDMSLENKYQWLENIFLDDIANKYIYKSPDIYFFQIKPILDKLEKTAGDYNIYKSFLARLNAYINMVNEDDRNPLAYVIILSVACDLKNKYAFGLNFLDLPLRACTEGMVKAREFHMQIRKWWCIYPGEFIKCVNEIDRTEEVEILEKELILKQNTKEALDIAISIVLKCPFDLTALTYIADSYRGYGDINSYNIFNESISVLWSKSDIDTNNNLWRNKENGK